MLVYSVGGQWNLLLCFCLFFVFIWDRVLLCISDCPGTLCRPGWPQTDKPRLACFCLLRSRVKGIGYHTQPVHPCLFFKTSTYNLRTSQGLKAHRCQEGHRSRAWKQLHEQCCFSSMYLQLTVPRRTWFDDGPQEDLVWTSLWVMIIILKNDIQNDFWTFFPILFSILPYNTWSLLKDKFIFSTIKPKVLFNYALVKRKKN